MYPIKTTTKYIQNKTPSMLYQLWCRWLGPKSISPSWDLDDILDLHKNYRFPKYWEVQYFPLSLRKFQPPSLTTYISTFVSVAGPWSISPSWDWDEFLGLLKDYRFSRCLEFPYLPLSLRTF